MGKQAQIYAHFHRLVDTMHVCLFVHIHLQTGMHPQCMGGYTRMCVCVHKNEYDGQLNRMQYLVRQQINMS